MAVTKRRICSVRIAAQMTASVTRQSSSAESRAVVLRCDGEQAQEAAAHRFLRAEPATVRDPLNGQTRLREQSPRRFHPQPLDRPRRGEPCGLRMVPAETALAHPSLTSEDRK